MHTLPVLLLAGCCALGLLLVPLGLPGLWVMVLGVIGYAWLTGFRSAGAGVIGAVVGLAVLGESVEWWLGFRFARVYGGSRRAAWGALVGGLVGAGIGVPLPVVGSIAGAFVGSFAGAALFEYAGAGHAGSAVRVGWGALLGRAAGTAAKVALGLAIAVVGVFAALRG
jgi:uncharacterized protein YqgC (DUF456 family)